MALKDILRKVAADTGATSYTSQADVRARLLELINEGADEIWSSQDLPGSLREISIRVPANYIIALPAFVGEIRAMRDVDLGRPWTLNDLRPRYHYNEWPQLWMNWRFIGYSAIKAEISNTAPPTVTIPIANSAISLTITGSTANSARTSETKALSATSNVFSTNFTSYDEIRLSALSSYDVTVSDADENELAIVYNNSLTSQYLMLDVSQYPSIGNCSDNTRLMEVLYKIKLPYLSNDNDIFPVPDYDKIIAAKAVQLFAERQEGQEQRAIMLHQKIEGLMNQKARNKIGTVEQKIKFGENKLYGMFSGYSQSTRFGARDCE